MRRRWPGIKSQEQYEKDQEAAR
eukprot:COSAG06_NODE_49979_length_321_cov_2.265766_1_plen_22_part_01